MHAMNESTSRELAHSLLATAGSLQGLEAELDRLSLHSLPQHQSEDPSWSSSWPAEDSLSVTDSPSSTGSVRQSRSRRSRSSSKFDSAISSLHSQTEHTSDEESSRDIKHSHKSKTRRRATFSQADWNWLYHTQPKEALPKRHASSRQRKTKRRSSRRQHDDEKSIGSSTTATPTSQSKAPISSHRTVLQFSSQLPTLEFSQRVGSIQSLSSTDSYSSSSSSWNSGALSVALSEEDILQIARLPDEVHTPKLRRTDSMVSDLISPQEQHAEVVCVPPPAPPEQEELLDSDNSSSTIVDETVQPSHIEYPEPAEVLSTSTGGAVESTAPLTPDIVVVSAGDDPIEQKGARIATSNKLSSTSPKLPRRYSRDSRDWLKPSIDSTKKTHPPKRSASFLQRIRLRRGTSFKTENTKKRVPVRRSFSDRMMYQIRKGLVEYKEDMNFISNPSHLRPIGRMIDKQAGRFHIVQLHRPPSGRYGIYITESAFRQGIFVSRFADASTAKFYTGLIAPGDEILKINKERVKGKTVDYVYEKLAKMDSVVFTILPVNSRPDW